MARVIPTPFGDLAIVTRSSGMVSLLDTVDGVQQPPLRINGIDYRPSGIFERVERSWGTFILFSHYSGLQRELTDNARRKLTDWAAGCWFELLHRGAEQHDAEVQAARWTLERAESALTDATAARDAAAAALAALQQ